MTNDQFIELVLESNSFLKSKYRTFSAGVLLEEIVDRVRKKE